MQPNSDGVVYLDEFSLSDAESMLVFDADAEHRKRFEFPDDFVPSLEHTKSVIRNWTEERNLGTRYAFAVRECETDILVGGCEIRPNDDMTANLSYWTHPSHRNRGIATRAVSIACGVASQPVSYTHLTLPTNREV